MREITWDPTTRKFKCDVAKIEGYRFNDDDRMKICSESLASGVSANETCVKFENTLKSETRSTVTLVYTPTLLS